MIAKQEDDIRSMKQDPAPVAPVRQGAETFGIPDKETPVSLGQVGLSDVPTSTPAPAMTSASEVAGLRPATLPAEEQATARQANEAQMPAEPGYTRESLERPKSAMMDIFHKKYAPKVISDLYESGDIDRAKAFEDWTRSAKGASYAEGWMKVTQAKMAGDEMGTMSGAIELYNKQLPDGEYAVGVPGKDGEFSIQIRDEKTNKVISTKKGALPDMTQAAVAMLAPEKAFSFLYGEEKTKADSAAALAKEQRGYEHARALEALKNRGASLTDLGKLRMERDALRAANPKDPDLAHYDRVIDNKGTHSPGVTVLAGTTPQPMEGGGYGTVVVPKGGGAGQLQPLAGAPNKVKEAEALVAGYEYKTLPGGKVLMPFRKGTNEMATQEEEDALAKAKILLQQNTKPGLK
jgi:hypothetical protein